MEPTGEKAKCNNCGTERPILESVSVIFGTQLYYLACKNCGCFYTSEDKIHWDLAWKINPELIKDGRKRAI